MSTRFRFLGMQILRREILKINIPLTTKRMPERGTYADERNIYEDIQGTAV